MKVIYDCDNTMGIKNRDIDDGLALIYLLNSDVDLLGVTTTYGNDEVEEVYIKTMEVLNYLGIGIPVKKGRGRFFLKDYESIVKKSPANILKDINLDEKRTISENEAAVFIVDTVNKYPGDISILATGSMQNIYDAILLDASIVEKINEVVLMGGVTEELIFGKKTMRELNFSIFSEGAKEVISKMKNISILTGNNCRPVEFTRYYLDKAASKKNMKNKFLIDKIESWMNDFKDDYNYNAIVLWDVVAAMYLTDKKIFSNNYCEFNSTYEDMKNGYLNVFPLIDTEIEVNNKKIINLPSVKNIDKVNELIIEKIF